MNEELKKKIIQKDKEFRYDEMEDETGLNNIEEDFGAATGVAPTPNLGRPTVNGIAVPSKSNKSKKSLKDHTQELKDLLDSLTK